MSEKIDDRSKQPLPDFSVRKFLREREALPVHFSTVMARRDKLLFPNDMKRAMTLVGTPVSFSTIQAGDDRHNVEGSVGLVVDFQTNESVVTVGPCDDGTYFDAGSGEWVSGGSPPTVEACARSIDERRTSNEWFIKDYTVIGLFVFCPILVRQACKQGEHVILSEAPIQLAAVLAHFPQLRVFSTRGGEFVEFDRDTGTWSSVEYSKIVPSS